MAGFDPNRVWEALPTQPTPVDQLPLSVRERAIAAGYQEVVGYLVPPVAGGGTASGASAPASGTMSGADRGAAVSVVPVTPPSPAATGATATASPPSPNPLVPPSAIGALFNAAAGAAAAIPSLAGYGPVDPVAAGLADGTYDRAAYEAAMGAGSSSAPSTPAVDPATQWANAAGAGGGDWNGASPPRPPVVAPGSQAERDGAGTQDIPNGGPGSPGYSNAPRPEDGLTGFVDRDGNGRDDRTQTTVGPTQFALPYGPLQGMPTLPTGWGSAINTGMGGFIPADGGGGPSLGGYGGGGGDVGGYPTGGTGGPASGGNFTAPGGGGGFTMPAQPNVTLPDVSQIGAGTTGGGTGGFTIPGFQNPLTPTGGGTGGSGTATGGTGATGGTSTPGNNVATGGTPVNNSGLVGNLANSYQNAMNSANAANENRFATGLELLLKRAEQAGSTIQGLNYEGMNDIGRMFGQQRARADQDLINRGLSNTTVREGIMRGYATDEQAARNRYADDQVRQNINENYRQQQGIVDWLGARNDVGPDMGQLANLASGVGTSGTTQQQGGTQQAQQQTGGTSPSTSQQPATGNVVNNPTNAQGRRVDISPDGQTQSVGGQQLSGPGQGSSGGMLTRGVPQQQSTAAQTESTGPTQQPLSDAARQARDRVLSQELSPERRSIVESAGNQDWERMASELQNFQQRSASGVDRFVSGERSRQQSRPEFSDPLGQAANLGNQQNRLQYEQQQAAARQANESQMAETARQAAEREANATDRVQVRNNYGQLVTMSRERAQQDFDGGFLRQMPGTWTPVPSQQSSSASQSLSGYGGSTGTASVQGAPDNGQDSWRAFQSGQTDTSRTGLPYNSQSSGNAIANPMSLPSVQALVDVQDTPSLPSGRMSDQAPMRPQVGSMPSSQSAFTPPPAFNPNKIAGAMTPPAMPTTGSQSLLGIMGSYGQSQPSGDPTWQQFQAGQTDTSSGGQPYNAPQRAFFSGSTSAPPPAMTPAATGTAPAGSPVTPGTQRMTPTLAQHAVVNGAIPTIMHPMGPNGYPYQPNLQQYGF